MATVVDRVAGGGGASAPLSLNAAVDATSINGLNLATTQTATAGNQKFSPALHFQGSGWKTNATAAAQSCDWLIETEPVENAAAPTNYLVFKQSVNGAAYSNIINFSTGEIYLTGAINLHDGTGSKLACFFGTGLISSNRTGGGFYFNAGNTNVQDTGLSSPSAGVVAVGTGAVGSFAGTIKSTTMLQESANGAQWIYGQASELLTIAAAASTDSSANLLPADAVIEAVVVRVTTVIPTAATFTVGDPTTAARFGTGISVAANTTKSCIDHWSGAVTTLAAGPSQAAAAKVRITPNLTPGAATGVVRITVFYRQFVAPTS